jgi:hypothetical protein
MTLDEAAAELARLFSGPPQPRGKWRWQYRQYDLVRRPSGFASFADVLLHCRERLQWASKRLMHCSKLDTGYADRRA